MIEREFITAVNKWQEFLKFLDELEKLEINLYEGKLYQLPDYIFDSFIDSHFTEEGSDLIYWWLYEDVPKVIYRETIFGKEETDVENIEDLWKYLISDKELYFK